MNNAVPTPDIRGQLAALPARSILRVAGTDRRAFLQGLVSNDLNACLPAQPIYAGFLTPQGKFLHDMFIVDAAGALLIDCEKTRAGDLLTRLQRYRLRSKVELDDISDSYEVWATWDAEAKPLPEGVGTATPPQTTPMHAPLDSRLWSNHGVIFVDPRLSALGERLIVRKGTYPYESPSADADGHDQHRLRLGIADGSRDLIVEKSTLLDGNFDLLHGISWSKGCYLGQELTARMHYRKLIKKRLFPVRLTDGPVATGTILTDGTGEIGEMRSSNGDYGLALLNIERALALAKTETPVMAGQTRLTLHPADWLISSLA